MPRKATNKDTIKKNTISDMKRLGVYKPQYDRVIGIYSELCEQYEKLTQKFVSSNYNCVSDTGAGGEKKDPLVATLESLRKDILQYSDRLCLNPKADSNVDPPKAGKSKLAEALGKLS